MSLVVWLPLTKDTRQQGLSSISVAGSPASWGNGKLGKCATWNGAVANVLYNNTTDFNYTNNFSVAFWANPVYTGSTAQYAWTVGRADAGGYGYGFQIISATTAQFRFGNGSYGVSAPSNEWHHFAMTIGNSKVTIYKDGIQVGSNNLPGTIPTYSDGNGMGLGCFHYSGNIYPYYGSLNDFRIYDHCLSPMEVKELAKGLVLHYPLNRQGWGQDNLLPGSYRADGNTTNKIYGWQANGNGTPEIIKVDNIDCIHLQANCTGKYIPSIVSASKVFLEYGVEYTISCDLKFDKDITVTNSTPIHYHSGSSSSTDEFNTANINNGHGFNFKSISPAAGTTIPANTWQHYEQHIIAKTAPTDSSLPYLTYRAFIYGSVRTISETVSVNMWLKNWKIEKGSIATPWCPNSSDELANTMGLNSTTEYDCSGFCNNGTRNGTFSWTSDTPKYGCSTKFVSGSRISFDSQVLTNNSNATLTAWVKLSSYTNDRCCICIWNGVYLTVDTDGYLSGYAYGKSSAGYHKSNAKVPLNTWTHIACIWDNAGLNLYINGTLDRTIACTGNFNSTSVCYIGQEGSGRPTNGNISDLRVYATALSADDVKSLYQNCATIDPDGTIRGQIRS